jgi:acetyltransferase-like isoleucine patch superfamily enzyme
MDEFEKCNAGELYSTKFPGREAMHLLAADLCWEYNNTRPSDMMRRDQIIRKLFGKVGKNCYVEPVMFCGFGFNIEVGDKVYVKTESLKEFWVEILDIK